MGNPLVTVAAAFLVCAVILAAPAEVAAAPLVDKNGFADGAAYEIAQPTQLCVDWDRVGAANANLKDWGIKMPGCVEVTPGDVLTWVRPNLGGLYAQVGLYFHDVWIEGFLHLSALKVVR